MRTLNFLMSLLLVAVSALVAVGQEREIAPDVYWTAMNKNIDTIRNLPTRITTTAEFLEKGIVVTTFKYTMEKTPGRKHSFEETTKDGKVETTEAIKVDAKTYCRNNDKPWKATAYFCGPSGMSGMAADSIMKFYLSAENLNGKSVSVYRLWVKEPKNTNVPPKYPDIFETKTWLDSDGRTLREKKSSTRSATGEKVYSQTSLYDYNPKGLKIEAPIK